MNLRPVICASSLFAGLAACQAPPETEPVVERAGAFLDPLDQDGEHYRLEFENEYVRVLRENVPAGTEVPMHSHRERVSVFLNDAEVTLAPDGGEPVRGELTAGTLRWDEPVTHDGFVHADVENLSIEMKDLDGEAIELPELDAVDVDPEHHVVDFENDRVRVVRMTYPPGAKIPLHTHRPGFGVFLTDAHGRNLPEDREPVPPVPIDAKARSTFWTEEGQPPHVTENLAEEELVVLLVEMKRRPD